MDSTILLHNESRVCYTGQRGQSVAGSGDDCLEALAIFDRNHQVAQDYVVCHEGKCWIMTQETRQTPGSGQGRGLLSILYPFWP